MIHTQALGEMEDETRFIHASEVLVKEGEVVYYYADPSHKIYIDKDCRFRRDDVFPIDPDYLVEQALKKERAEIVEAIKTHFQHMPRSLVVRQKVLRETVELIEARGKPIEQLMEDIAKEVPESEWDKLPEDLSDNLDRYVYPLMEGEKS